MAGLCRGYCVEVCLPLSTQYLSLSVTQCVENRWGCSARETLRSDEPATEEGDGERHEHEAEGAARGRRVEVLVEARSDDRAGKDAKREHCGDDPVDVTQQDVCEQRWHREGGDRHHARARRLATGETKHDHEQG